MTFDQGRVAEIFVSDGNIRPRGTGYLLFSGCLLTAFHVVKKSARGRIEFRLLRDAKEKKDNWLSAELIWSGLEYGFDLALLKFTTEADSKEKLPTIKKLNQKFNLGNPASCTLCGFPSFRKRHEQGKPILHPYAPSARLQSLDPEFAKKEGELLLEVEGAIPSDMKKWQGISGSAVFTDDGCLLGVVIKYPEELQGRELEAIALENVIEADTSFNEKLWYHFGQKLCCLDVDEINEKEIFNIELALHAANLRKKLYGIQIAKDELLITQLQPRLKELNRNYQSKSSSSSLPSKKLLKLLEEIEASDGEIFWAAWRDLDFKKFSSDDLTVYDIYVLLSDAKNPEILHIFISKIHHLLSRKSGQQEHVKKLTELAKVVFNKDLHEIQFLVEPTKEKSHVGKGCLLVKIQIKSSNARLTTYSLTIWMIGDRHSYQLRMKDSDSQLSNLEGYADKVVEEASIEVKSNDLKTQGEIVKQKLSKLFNELWENKSLGISVLKPEVIFCVPQQLLEVDFQNIEFGDLLSFEIELPPYILGCELPVYVSCLDRYEKLPNSSKAFWLDRWGSLENCCEPSLDRLAIHDNRVDITCLRQLRDWLLRKDTAKEKPVAGIGFYKPHSKLTTALRNFLIFGLPIAFWPDRSLDEREITSLKESLKVSPMEMLATIHRYRIHHREDNAGPVSILFDNPYLPPPDCEIDY